LYHELVWTQEDLAFPALQGFIAQAVQRRLTVGFSGAVFEVPNSEEFLWRYYVAYKQSER
jgi:hypothetical protein